MTSSFQFFPHLIIKYKVSFRNKDIQDLLTFILADDKLCLLVFFVLILDDHWLFLDFFFLIKTNPVQSQLLVMDNYITLNDLLFEFLHFFFIHRLDFVVSFQIRFLKMLEFPLKLLKLPVNSFIVSCHVFVGIFKLKVLFLILLPEI